MASGSLLSFLFGVSLFLLARCSAVPDTSKTGQTGVYKVEPPPLIPSKGPFLGHGRLIVFKAVNLYIFGSHYVHKIGCVDVNGKLDKKYQGCLIAHGEPGATTTSRFIQSLDTYCYDRPTFSCDWSPSQKPAIKISSDRLATKYILRQEGRDKNFATLVAADPLATKGTLHVKWEGIKELKPSDQAGIAPVISQQPKKAPFSFKRRRFYVGTGDDVKKYKYCLGKLGDVVPISSNACYLHTIENGRLTSFLAGDEAGCGLTRFKYFRCAAQDTSEIDVTLVRFIGKKVGYQLPKAQPATVWQLEKGKGHNPTHSVIAEKSRRTGDANYPPYYIRYDIDEWGRVVK